MKGLLVNLDNALFASFGYAAIVCFKLQRKEELEIKDEGHIELLLRVLAWLCDGQNVILQV